jgi:hypothetical protein
MSSVGTAETASKRRDGDIILDDLTDPQFPPGVREILDAIAASEVPPLDPDALREAAVAQTGLADFGDPDFSEPLEILCRSLRTEAGLSRAGIVMATGQLIGHLRTRLRAEDLLRRHPEILDVPIERPIVVAGLPRSGTTHLHNLLSADSALRSLPYWESLEPIPSPDDPPGEAGVAARMERTRAALEFTNGVMPHFKAMHEMTAEHSHEEVQLMTPIFSTCLFESQWRIPEYAQWYAASDQRPAYAYLKKMLQILQWQRGGTRWVLKSPSHLEQFGPLIEEFPDATVILTHRDPVTVTASFATMVSYAARTSVEHPDPIAIGKHWAARTEQFLMAAVRDRELLPADQSLDVLFPEFMADEMAVVEQIYTLAGQPMPDSSRAALRSYLDGHQRGRHGTVSYDLATVGLDLAERRAALRPYSERFGVPDDRW